MRHVALKARTRRAEAILGAAAASATCVVRLRPGEGREAALAAFSKAAPQRRRGLGLLLVPAKVSGEAERERFASRFEASQLGLVADARSERIVIEQEAPEVVPSIVRHNADAPAEPPARMRGNLGTFNAPNRRYRVSKATFAKLSGVEQF